MWDHHLTSGEAVGVERLGIAPCAVQETMQLTLRMVEPASARPPVGTAKDCLVTKVGLNPIHLGGNEFVGDIPTDLHEWLVAAHMVVGTWTVVEPALADHRCLDSCRPLQHIHDPESDVRWVSILFKRMELGDGAVMSLHSISTPVRACEWELLDISL